MEGWHLPSCLDAAAGRSGRTSTGAPQVLARACCGLQRGCRRRRSGGWAALAPARPALDQAPQLPRGLVLLRILLLRRCAIVLLLLLLLLESVRLWLCLWRAVWYLVLHRGDAAQRQRRVGAAAQQSPEKSC